MSGELVTALKDAFRWDALDAADARTAADLDRRLLRSRARLVRASGAGLIVGAALTVGGYWTGGWIEDALNAATDGGWSYFSKWLGEAGLLPLVFCGIGGIVFLLGVYRLMTVVVPPLAGAGPLARFARIALLAIFGAALVTAAGLFGFIRVGGD